MTCPRCSATLGARTFEGIEYPHCETCGPVWPSGTLLGHPIRETEIRSYQGDNDAIAVLVKASGGSFPAPMFVGSTREDARAHAEAWRRAVIEQNEAKVVARRSAAAKRKSLKDGAAA